MLLIAGLTIAGWNFRSRVSRSLRGLFENLFDELQRAPRASRPSLRAPPPPTSSSLTGWFAKHFSALASPASGFLSWEPTQLHRPAYFARQHR